MVVFVRFVRRFSVELPCRTATSFVINATPTITNTTLDLIVDLGTVTLQVHQLHQEL
jgi:hypothetical protein